MEDIDFRVVNAVNDSWDQIKRIPNYDAVAGEILFRKIFEIAPPALNMYSFGSEFVGREGELYKSPAFKAHSSGVVKTLDAAVGMLGPDLEIAAKVLADLGAKHVAYGVLPAHYGIVGEALLHTLETALGDSWTPNVKKGWTVIYAFLSTAMLAGSNRRMDKVHRRKARLAKVNGEPVPTLKDTTARGVSIPGEVLTELEESSALTPAARRRLEDLAECLRTGEDGSESPSTRGPAADDQTETTTSCSSDEEDDAVDVDYSKMVEIVSTSWETVKKMPNCEEVAGVLLFRNIFDIAPQAKDLFAFSALYKNNDEEIFKDPAFLRHARGVVAMLDAAVNLLGPDLEPVTRTLKHLGARHTQYGVVEAHYPIVGEALLKTLETALGDQWTATVKQGWVSIFTFISTTMLNGAEQSISESLEDQLEL